MKKRLTFSECEHEGDLAGYVADVHRVGGHVISSRVLEDEEGEVIVEVPDLPAWGRFLMALADTPSGEFCINSHLI